MRTWGTGVVLVALMVGLVACTGDEDDGKDRSTAEPTKKAATACADGTFTWSGIKKTKKLTGVSEVQELGDGGGELKGGIQRVYTPRPSATAEGPALSVEEILYSLGKKIGEIDSGARTLAEAKAGGDEDAFTDANRAAPDLDDGTVRMDAGGEYVTFAAVTEQEGDFSYSCPGGRTTTGHASNWTVVINGVLECTEKTGSALAREAATRSCPAGSAAETT